MGVIIKEEKDNELIIRSVKAEELARGLFPEFIAYLTEIRKYTLDFLDYKSSLEKNIITLGINNMNYRGMLEYHKIIPKNDFQNPDHIRIVTIDEAAIVNAKSKKRIKLMRINNERIDEYIQIPL